MIHLKTEVKIWGNSFGVVIPKEVAIKEDIHEKDKITITITKKETLEDFFGKLKKKINTQKMKDESRNMWKMNKI